jgi:hypothetical protein
MCGYEKNHIFEIDFVRFGVSFRQSVGFTLPVNGTSLSKNSQMKRHQ